MDEFDRVVFQGLKDRKKECELDAKQILLEMYLKLPRKASTIDGTTVQHLSES